MKKMSLKISMPSDREIAMSRVFDAPLRMVWDAFTKAELVKKWLWGPDGWVMSTCELELRAGGKYRYVWTHSDGRSMGMGGTFREVKPLDRFVATEKFDVAWYDGEALCTTTFVEENGKTLMTQTMMYASKAVRDGILGSGMEKGVAASYDRLGELLKG